MQALSECNAFVHTMSINTLLFYKVHDMVLRIFDIIYVYISYIR